MTAASTLATELRELEELRDGVEERYRRAVSAADRDRASGLAAIALHMLGKVGEVGVLRKFVVEGAAAAPVPACDVPAPPRGRRPVPAPAAPSADDAPSVFVGGLDPWGDIEKADAAAKKTAAQTTRAETSAAATKPTTKAPRRSRGGSRRS